MTSWWKVNGLNAYVNPAQCRSIYATSVGGGNYQIQCDTNVGNGQYAETLQGTFPSQASAEAAIVRLVQGIDPSTF